MSRASEIVAKLTLEQKAALTNGDGFWWTSEQPGLPKIVLTDGPHGVRMQRGDEVQNLADSIPTTCFPPAVTLASTWDPQLVERVGVALGEESQAEGVGVLLGPGVNIKRSPLCGRNFEYFSEDPLLAGTLGAAHVRGLQSQGVGASLKHFAANNQEADRMRSSSDVDPRPLREIYLKAFQQVVTEAKPWTVMCSYNRVNGEYASQNHWLLTEVLRDEWGFGGLVVSDWGAVADKIAALRAGLDLDMPGNAGKSAAKVVEAVRTGELDEAELDRAAIRVAELIIRAVESAKPGASYDREAHHEVAREVAAAGIVLLENDGVLPLAADASYVVIGELARTPRFQGAGSSLINPTRLDSALDGLSAVTGAAPAFAAGYRLDGTVDEALSAEALQLAGTADTVLLFLGVPSQLESEGFDRADIELPSNQLELLGELLKAGRRVVLVLSNGGVVRLSGIAEGVAAIVEGWLLGQAGGLAIADVLTGRVNPSGRLAETIPVRLQDTPCYLDFPGENGHVRYGEGLFVGYRWYEAREIAVSYPFGHGLSYTSFDYQGFRASTTADGGIEARVTVRNTGLRDGHEVVQLYVARPDSKVVRPKQVLAGFQRVAVRAGEELAVTIRVPRSELAHWDTRVDEWVVEGGLAEVHLGASSADIRARAEVQIVGDELDLPLTLDSTIGDLLENPIAGPIFLEAAKSMLGGSSTAEEIAEMLPMAASAPLGRLASLGMGDTAQVQQLIDLANGPEWKGKLALGAIKLQGAVRRAFKK